MNIQLETMHKRKTYDELVFETTTNPTDKIELPDRQATFLRRNAKLTVYDDEQFTDLNDDNKKIQKNRLQQQTLRTEVTNNTNNTYNTTHIVQQAVDSAVPLDAPMPSSGPDPPNPPGDAPKFYRNN